MTGGPRCALIGAGNIGTPMAARLLDRGFDLTVCDRDPARRDALAAMGAATTPDAAECAAHDAVLVVVSTETQLRAVAGDIASARSGPGPATRLAIMSTVPAGTVWEIATTLGGAGIAVVDAPVSGGADRAAAGELTIMAGGEAADIAALDPVFSALATNVIACGGVGAGQSVKIVNNILCHAIQPLMAEALRLGLGQGLSTKVMIRAMEVSTGRNWLTADPALPARLMAAQTADRATHDGIVGILRKDMAIARDLAHAGDGDYPMIAGVADLVDGLGDETWDTWRVIAGTGPRKG
ncbi:NAD-binding protein [Rhodobacterales bacterium HKCCE2091]|nr:NAD-binding protein [Rhodobacterales bacterium HKCCE2091]